MSPMLAITAYWSVVWLSAAAGLGLVVFTCFRRRGWWWKLLLAVALIVGPYLADVVRCRVSDGGESWLTAAMPTTVLLALMGPDTNWPYGEVFGRLNKAPARHAMWDRQLDRLADWCGECVALKDSAMAKRGVQIAGTIAQRGNDRAIDVLGEALTHGDPAIRLLACDVLMGLGARAEQVRAAIAAAANGDSEEQVRHRAGKVLAGMGGGK